MNRDLIFMLNFLPKGSELIWNETSSSRNKEKEYKIKLHYLYSY